MSKKREKKSHGFRNFLIYCAIICGIWYWGTFTLKTTEVTVESEKLNGEMTIVQLSDLHGATFGEDNERLIRRIDEAEPDFIVATGDMYTAGDEEGRDCAVSLLGDLARRYPVYSVHGEHDNEADYEEELTAAGVDVLDYECRDITAGGQTVRLYGITNVFYTDTFDLHNEFIPQESDYNILAAHINNFEDFAEAGMDLSLCGDSHGGQVRLPGIGGLINQGVWLPEREAGNERFTKGLYEMDGRKLFVSSGLGNYPVPVRFLNRPEVAVIHLRGK